MLKPIRLHKRLARNLVVIAVLLILTISGLATGLFMPVEAASMAQKQDATSTPDIMQPGGMGQGMSMAEMGAVMDQMMANMQSMMGNMPMAGTMPISGTMSMSDTMPMPGMMHSGMMQMCQMMHMNSSMQMTATTPMTGMEPLTESMSMMGSTPMTSAMPMLDMMSTEQMGMMIQMMGMMQMHMGCMQMMMGAMMSGGMMGEGTMNGDRMEGMENGNAPANAAEAESEATATIVPSTTAVISESAESSEAEAATNDSGHPDPKLATAPQSATAGAITVEATPQASDELLEIAFVISLETHSVELDFDLAERATLTIGEFGVPATSWEPNAPSGHHVQGTLHFNIDHPIHAALAEVDTVTLELQDIDGQLVTLNFPVE